MFIDSCLIVLPCLYWLCHMSLPVQTVAMCICEITYNFYCTFTGSYTAEMTDRYIDFASTKPYTRPSIHTVILTAITIAVVS